jgi:hypothetical protein
MSEGQEGAATIGSGLIAHRAYRLKAGPLS